MKFWKMNGAGNDFVLINNMEERIPAEQLPRLAEKLCTRRLSVGADGMMVVEAPTLGGDLKMLFYNSDGSLGEMCGNGARCICRYAYETGLAKGDTQTIETTAGIVTGVRIDKRAYRVRLNDPSVIEVDHPLAVNGTVYPASYVVLGDPGIPHACVPIKNLAQQNEDELRALGRAMRFHPTFPKGANVNFYEILETGEILEKTYERGVEDFTYACGTGTGSVAAALAVACMDHADSALPTASDAEKTPAESGQLSSNFASAVGSTPLAPQPSPGVIKEENDHRVHSFTLHMAGGTLTVDVVLDGKKVHDLFLSGPTNIVAIGEITDEELTLR